MTRGIRRGVVVVGLCLSISLLTARVSAASGSPSVPLPAAGELLAPRVVARTAPDSQARPLRVLRQFRSASEFQIVLAIRARRADGVWWYELSLPGRPNGRRGWVPGDALDLRSMKNRIVVHVRDRRIEVRRIADGRLLLSGIVAVGKPGAETPLGRNFYVQARVVPSDPFYGPFVLVTSAYSKLSDWPGGGLAGIHGTNRPGLLGQAVSHGCVRVSNGVAHALERLAPLGTPIDLLP